MNSHAPDGKTKTRNGLDAARASRDGEVALRRKDAGPSLFLAQTGQLTSWGSNSDSRDIIYKVVVRYQSAAHIHSLEIFCKFWSPPHQRAPISESGQRKWSHLDYSTHQKKYKGSGKQTMGSTNRRPNRQTCIGIATSAPKRLVPTWQHS